MQTLLFQISKAIAGADRKDLMRKLPKFIYDEEKALEVTWKHTSFFSFFLSLINSTVYFALMQKTRKVLADKIAQLNSAIDDVSSQLKSEDTPNGAALSTDEVEATAWNNLICFRILEQIVGHCYLLLFAVSV